MKLALITSFLVIALRFALFKTGHPAEGTDFMFVHFMAIVTLVFFQGKRMLLNDPLTGIADLLREGFKVSAIYALLIGIYLWIHYTYVESAYFGARIDALVALGVAEGNPEELIRERMEKFFTPFNYASMTFFVLLIVGAVNTMLIGLLHHKVLRRITR